jgi:hypothetical protein
MQKHTGVHRMYRIYSAIYGGEYQATRDMESVSAAPVLREIMYTVKHNSKVAGFV